MTESESIIVLRAELEEARSELLNAIRDERERCSAICEQLALESEPDDFALDALNLAAEKIRQGK